MKKLFLLGILLCSSFALGAVGDFAPLLELQRKIPVPKSEPDFLTFLVSTEMAIGKTRPILEKAPGDLYLTIGSERGFRGFSMAQNTKHLVLLDISPDVVRFNRINIELFKAPTLEEYKSLRWTSDLKSWMSLKNARLSEEDFRWWDKNVRDLTTRIYPLPEMLNRYGKDIILEKLIPIYSKLKQIHQAAEKSRVELSKETLFYESTHASWIEWIQKLNLPLALSQEEWSAWKKGIGDEKKPGYAFPLTKSEDALIDPGTYIEFKAGNYLYDAKLYSKLHRAALENRMTSIVMDLTQKDDLRLLIAAIYSSQLKLGVLDLDNLFDSSYIGQKIYHQLVQHFLDLGHPDSILIVMNNYLRFGTGQFQTYLGFTFENVRLWPKEFQMNDFFNTLPKPVLDIINGKLYQNIDLPPLLYLKK